MTLYNVLVTFTAIDNLPDMQLDIIMVVQGEGEELFFVVGSGQSLTCTFRASCCSAHLSQANVLALASSFVRDRKKKGGGNKGYCLHWQVK